MLASSERVLDTTEPSHCRHPPSKASKCPKSEVAGAMCDVTPKPGFGDKGGIEAEVSIHSEKGDKLS